MLISNINKFNKNQKTKYLQSKSKQRYIINHSCLVEALTTLSAHTKEFSPPNTTTCRSIQSSTNSDEQDEILRARYKFKVMLIEGTWGQIKNNIPNGIVWFQYYDEGVAGFHVFAYVNGQFMVDTNPLLLKMHKRDSQQWKILYQFRDRPRIMKGRQIKEIKTNQAAQTQIELRNQPSQITRYLYDCVVNLG